MLIVLLFLITEVGPFLAALDWSFMTIFILKELNSDLQESISGPPSVEVPASYQGLPEIPSNQLYNLVDREMSRESPFITPGAGT